MDKHLHIVTHDVPWPADFGGVVDLFYKIKALHSFGINIHLHCFTGGRAEQKILNKYCVSVNYYPRKKGWAGLSLKLPYIVRSRSDIALLETLEKDHYPILLEGIHCTYFLHNDRLKNRKVYVRLHNVEYKYYAQLAKLETNIIRRTYFTIESRLLKKYEQQLAKKSVLWAVSHEDELVYRKKFHAAHIQFLPVFLPWYDVNTLTGNGNFCLYHGNLSVNENEKAVTWLLQEVFNEINIPLVIAGKAPSPVLISLIGKNPLCTLVADPSETVMQDLIQKAQLHILPSFNNTGVKLKLLNALYNGRHCVVNKAAVEGSGVELYCNIVESPAEFKTTIRSLFNEPFTEEKIRQRSSGLKEIYNWEHNAQKVIAWIY